MQELGLTVSYREDEGTRAYCRNLMAMPLLPHEHVRPVFDQVTTPLPEDERLQQLTAYCRNTWIDGPVFRPADWSVFGQSVRTNNDCEGWHGRLNRKARRGSLPLYLLIQLLESEGNDVRETATLVFREEVTRIQRAGATRSTKRLHQFWAEYRDPERTRSARSLLNAGGNLICPVDRD